MNSALKRDLLSRDGICEEEVLDGLLKSLARDLRALVLVYKLDLAEAGHRSRLDQVVSPESRRNLFHTIAELLNIIVGQRSTEVLRSCTDDLPVFPRSTRQTNSSML